jgi:hypothetical protein
MLHGQSSKKMALVSVMPLLLAELKMLLIKPALSFLPIMEFLQAPGLR